MDQIKQEITHKNVERLVEAMKADRQKVSDLITKVKGLEAKVAMLEMKLIETTARSNAAFALSTGGSSTER